MGCVLRCLEGPAVGADTMWANMVLAYENLPAQVKTEIAGLRGGHSIEASTSRCARPTWPAPRLPSRRTTAPIAR
ncbi:hypothetical protein CBM2592_A10113 [Cupriavidus taiwanensis]|nr:hypothetical protein CBM2588_A10111 [Cupriavidus taiwanensis]SOY42397.1 hypothetical protein CBM2592_A10113 [Cupriavidus taiwanensis]SOY78991.1 hypothetical protein CBM2591_A10111 [Cupriavidus taiwanensis]SOZ50309.1 hypothetical protein CBM2617_A10060 [Cupriavidus taiwanensis]SOZ75656.1 hypothetical protein CBM2622_A10061 [Cupriavidus taiwanensis]